MYLTTAEGYKNGGVQFLRVRKTDEIWPSMKDVGRGMGVKNIYFKNNVMTTIIKRCRGKKKGGQKSNRWN